MKPGNAMYSVSFIARAVFSYKQSYNLPFQRRVLFWLNLKVLPVAKKGKQAPPVFTLLRK
jgi:hypothetical protein